MLCCLSAYETAAAVRVRNTSFILTSSVPLLVALLPMYSSPVSRGLQVHEKPQGYNFGVLQSLFSVSSLSVFRAVFSRISNLRTILAVAFHMLYSIPKLRSNIHCHPGTFYLENDEMGKWQTGLTTQEKRHVK